jgi:hypothetical protein
MRAKHWYLVLALVGTILPYSQFVPFLREHGLDAGLFWRQLFANRISAFFALDVLVSSAVLWAFVLWEGRRNRLEHLWAPIIGSLAVGVSLGLPLFLYIRERQLESRCGGRATAS